MWPTGGAPAHPRDLGQFAAASTAAAAAAATAAAALRWKGDDV